MTSEPAAARFDQRSLIGISTSIGAAVVVGLVCSRLHIQPQVTGTLTAGAASLPAAIEYSWRGRRRNVADDISRIRQGELRRPVALVVVMLTAALFLAEVIAEVIDHSRALPLPLELRVETELVFVGLIAGALAFFISWYASHYLGKHPYRWTVVAVGAVFVLVEATFAGTIHGLTWPERAHFWFYFVGSNSIMLNASLAGVWCGRRRHDKFLAKKLVRLERKAAKEALVIRPNDVPSAPDSHRTSDPIKQIEKLAHLRDAGALTEEEFQAKKTQILGQT
jgi:Short C-terminal domain